MEKKRNVLIMLILFYPIGIYGMLKHEHFNKITRRIILVFFGFVTIWLFQIAGSDPDNVSQEYDQEELEQIVADMPQDVREELVLEEIQFAMEEEADVTIENETFTYVPHDVNFTQEMDEMLVGERDRASLDAFAAELRNVSENMMFILGEGYTHQLVDPNNHELVYIQIRDDEIVYNILDDE